MIYRFCAVLLLLSPTLSTTPGERVLELLSQVKTNTESHEEIADQHESIRAGVCQSKTTVLAEKIAVLRSRLLAVNGHPIDPSVAELNATESGRANLTETTILDSITTAHRQQDIDVYVHQMSKLSSLRNTVANGFQHNLDGFSTALNIRSMSHDMFVNHQTQYDSYASTMDMMLSLMERHAGKEEAHAAVRAAETQEVAEHADVLNQKTIENEEHKVEQHQQQELYDARAERMYETVAAVSKQLAEHMALERALDKEADDAWSVALLERTQLGEETDTMLKDLDQKKVVLQKEISNLGGLMKGNASATIVPVDPEIILKLKTEMKRYNEELEMWSNSCTSQANTFVMSQTQRSSLMERVDKLQSYIHESLMTSKSVVGASASNPNQDVTKDDEEEEEDTSTTSIQSDDMTAATPLTPEENNVANSAYNTLQEHLKLSPLPLEGAVQSIASNGFKKEIQKDESIRYSFEIETDKKEIVRMVVVRESNDALTVEFASAEVVASPGLTAAEQPKELDVKDLVADLDDDKVDQPEEKGETGTSEEVVEG